MDLRSAKYLDPKNDLTFKKIFGEHAHITKSFLNALLPFEKGQYIEELYFGDKELIQELPELKYSIVDVNCTDNKGRQFIVEMQLYWSDFFKSRMLFNSGKAYVKQINIGDKYTQLKPVYGLSLVNENFLNKSKYSGTYYHHFQLSHTRYPEQVIKGLELIFIELPKFKTQNFTERKMQYLWLKFLTEIDENTKEVPKELLDNKEISEALTILNISAFSKEELDYYDKYWDRVRVERTLMTNAFEEGKKQSEKELKAAQKREEIARQQAEQERKEKEEKAEQLKQAEQQAEQERKEKEEKAEQLKQAKLKLAIKMKKYGETIEEIIKETGLSKEELNKLL